MTTKLILRWMDFQAKRGHGLRGKAVQGQAMTEFLIIAALVTLAMALGSPSPLEQVISALQRFYIRFSTAMSMP